MNSIFSESYHELADSELAKLAASGNDDAVICLISRYVPLVRSRAAVFADSATDNFEDLCQEGMIGLLAAARTYQEGKSSFLTFARLCVDRMLSTACRGMTRKKTIPQKQLVTIDGLDENNLSDRISSGNEYDPESIVIERETLIRLRSKLNSKLTGLESAVLFDYIGGRTYNEIALRNGISAKAVDNALQRIRRKLR